MKIGTLCIKLAGRDAGKMCVVVEPGKEKQFVVVDGNTRRKKCNVKHLEPFGKELKINAGASHEEVVKAMEAAGVAMIKRKKSTKTKEKTSKPVKKRKVKKKDGPAKK